MKVYTSVTYQMTKDGMEEISSESFDYEGPVAHAGGGGSGTNTVERHYYYDGGPGSQPDISGAVGIEGLTGATGATGATGEAGISAPNLNAADSTAGFTPSGYAYGAGSANPTGGSLIPNTPTAPANAINPTINYQNPYDMMNQMKAPTGIASLNPNIKPTV